MKRQPKELEKIAANDATNKGLMSKIYKQLIILNNNNNKNNRKMGRRPNQTDKLLHSKGNHKKKIQAMEWEKIAANDATNKDLISKI